MESELTVTLEVAEPCHSCGKLTNTAEDIGCALPVCSIECQQKFWQGYFEELKENE